MANSSPQARNVLTVSQLNRATSQLLGDHFLSVLVEGEISNLSIPSSGHFYFTLKDANAQVRCAMFRSQQRRLSFKPDNGRQVIVRAQVSLYEPRGDYQLIVDHIEEAGDGALRRAFDVLKEKLANEGLFDAAYKLYLPTLPVCIGIITSPTGAAVHDILSVLQRRFPAIPIVIYPVAVQGENAKYDIANAIATANHLQQCDLLIVGRGGGSLEDLWAFNEEIVARAIFASAIPIISAVGHETDFTIADFVADLRAPTPSAAAEHATPDYQQWLSRFLQLEMRLQQQLQRKLNQQQQACDWLIKRLIQQHPKQKLQRNEQRLEELEDRLTLAMQTRLNRQAAILATQSATLWQYNPAIIINAYKQRLHYLNKQLITASQQKLSTCSQQFNAASQTLHIVSPLATLNRGYTLTTDLKSGNVVTSIKQLAVGDVIETRLAQGRFSSQIKDIKPVS
ncbi:MAG: exodeoxyribonuclease VII large subunit [Methylococcaceae bacterium]|nr:exodeoxyribonuclease VII large subunit [Methylococcaceae bacterium]